MSRINAPTSTLEHPAKAVRRIEGSGSGLLALENAGPVQMGFWVPNRVWATAKFRRGSVLAVFG
jgi:phosphatidylserine decarboxylase